MGDLSLETQIELTLRLSTSPSRGPGPIDDEPEEDD